MNLHRQLCYQQQRKVGVHPINQEREQLREYHHVFQELNDEKKNFIAIDIGAYGRQSDGRILCDSHLGVCLQNGTINISGPKPPLTSNIILPYVIFSDKA